MIYYVKGKKTVIAAEFKAVYDALDSDTRKICRLFVYLLIYISLKTV